MKVAYFDCFAGASGDMILGALVDGGWPLDDLKGTFAKLPLDGYEVKAEEVRKGMLRALYVHIEIDANENTVERNLSDIEELLNASSLDEDILEKIQIHSAPPFFSPSSLAFASAFFLAASAAAFFLASFAAFSSAILLSRASASSG